MTTFEKFLSVLKSRRFWVAVLTVVSSVALLLGIDVVDPETGADQIMPLMDALTTILIVIIPLVTGVSLIGSYSGRAASKDDS
jgi:hypothetical protein